MPSPLAHKSQEVIINRGKKNWMRCLVCGFTKSGARVLCRAYGNYPVPPEPVCSVLFATHCQTESLATLEGIVCSDCRTTFKLYADNFLLVLIAPSEVPGEEANNLLDVIWDALVITLGLVTILTAYDIESLIRAAFPILDWVLGCSSCGTTSCTCWRSSRLPLCVTADAIEEPLACWLRICPDVKASTGKKGMLVAPQHIASVFNSFLESLASSIAGSPPLMGLFFNFQLVATNSPWRAKLNYKEVNLISIMLACLPPSKAREIPLFLPYFGTPETKGKTPYRLLTFLLSPSIELCMVCGLTPSLSEITSDLLTTSLNSTALAPVAYSSLLECVSAIPCDVCADFVLDPYVSAFLVSFRKQRRVGLSICPRTVKHDTLKPVPTISLSSTLSTTLSLTLSPKDTENSTLERRRTVLLQFYRENCYLISQGIITSAYMITQGFSLCAVQSSDTDVQVYVLLSNRIPQYAALPLCRNLLTHITMYSPPITHQP
ncbi:hypothetical protein Pelo_1316 [Pelomyxa schiedti]|nr:hypothetical protein Pelo_1316 [Pelomyxa schiedti]